MAFRRFLRAGKPVTQADRGQTISDPQRRIADHASNEELMPMRYYSRQRGLFGGFGGTGMMRCLWLPAALVLTAAAAHATEAARPVPVPFQVNELWGYRNAEGSFAIEPRFHVATPFTPQGSAAVATDDGWAIIDRNGKVLLRPFTVDNWPDEYSEGLARFIEGGKIGFFDPAGRKAIEARYDLARPFSEGRAAVCRGCRVEAHGEHSSWAGGRWGYIARSGELAVPYDFEQAGQFRNGRAEVQIEGHRIIIDANGNPSEAR